MIAGFAASKQKWYKITEWKNSGQIQMCKKTRSACIGTKFKRGPTNKEAIVSYFLINKDALPHYGGTYELEGYLYGNTNVCLILLDLPPGEGPKLHSHPYEEIFILQEGSATYTIGSTTLEAKAGQIAIVAAGVPHKFVNSGSGRLRQLDIHHSPKFITDWLEN